jgi:FixJ family two-component response regulator
MNASLPTETVALVDDDKLVTAALARVLRAEGWHVAVFGSAEEFLARHAPEAPSCIVLDLTMPGLDGLALQRHLNETEAHVPIVFLTGHGDIPMSVRAVKAGATDFLTKPVKAHTLVQAVGAALAAGRAAREARAEIAALKERLASLTEREREVLVAIANGRLNKQIAADLGIVEQTVKYHRARLMERMGARTAAELMRIAVRLGIEPEA